MFQNFHFRGIAERRWNSVGQILQFDDADWLPQDDRPSLGKVSSGMGDACSPDIWLDHPAPNDPIPITALTPEPSLDLTQKLLGISILFLQVLRHTVLRGFHPQVLACHLSSTWTVPTDQRSRSDNARDDGPSRRLPRILRVLSLLRVFPTHAFHRETHRIGLASHGDSQAVTLGVEQGGLSGGWPKLSPEEQRRCAYRQTSGPTWPA